MHLNDTPCLKITNIPVKGLADQVVDAVAAKINSNPKQNFLITNMLSSNRTAHRSPRPCARLPDPSLLKNVVQA